MDSQEWDDDVLRLEKERDAALGRVEVFESEKAKLEGWPPVTDKEYAMILGVATHQARQGFEKTADAIMRLLKRPPELSPDENKEGGA